jgi:hypothetical protein
LLTHYGRLLVKQLPGLLSRQHPCIEHCAVPSVSDVKLRSGQNTADTQHCEMIFCSLSLRYCSSGVDVINFQPNGPYF